MPGISFTTRFPFLLACRSAAPSDTSFSFPPFLFPCVCKVNLRASFFAFFLFRGTNAYPAHLLFVSTPFLFSPCVCSHYGGPSFFYPRCTPLKTREHSFSFSFFRKIRDVAFPSSLWPYLLLLFSSFWLRTEICGTDSLWAFLQMALISSKRKRKDLFCTPLFKIWRAQFFFTTLGILSFFYRLISLLRFLLHNLYIAIISNMSFFSKVYLFLFFSLFTNIILFTI